MALLTSGWPVLSTNLAVNDCVLPTMSGPAVAGERVSLAPARELWMLVVNELDTGPYLLPLASCQVTAAVSVRLPGVWEAGTSYVAWAEPDWPTLRLAGVPVTVPVAPPGRESVTVMAAASAPPMFWSVSGFTSVLPAVTWVGPDLKIVTMGRCSAVVTRDAIAVRVPLNPVPDADAVALSDEPSRALKRAR